MGNNETTREDWRCSVEILKYWNWSFTKKWNDEDTQCGGNNRGTTWGDHNEEMRSSWANGAWIKKHGSSCLVCAQPCLKNDMPRWKWNCTPKWRLRTNSLRTWGYPCSQFRYCPQIGLKNPRVGWKIVIRFLSTGSANDTTIMWEELQDFWRVEYLLCAIEPVRSAHSLDSPKSEVKTWMSAPADAS